MYTTSIVSRGSRESVAPYSSSTVELAWKKADAMPMRTRAPSAAESRCIGRARCGDT